MAKCDEDMYHLVCKERFDNLDNKQDEIIGLLRGQNSSPGLVEEVRHLKSRWAVIFGFMVVIGTALTSQMLRWIFSFFD